ncbi:GFA family protein [Vibrio astriarenae]|uniref:GFA family protein n=1 Tax=Vibrio astriarenae TaxID=1481923 RepID=A0A7Z2T5Z1_9VIBR|nr:GFA family protein [Vibrio astriarenae]
MEYFGSCHCGEIQFSVEAPEIIEADLCNCSVCRKSGYLHLIVPKSKFQLLKGREKLEVYTFNTHVAKHYFCRVCGMKPFYVPRSNPDGMDINVNCIDTAITKLLISDFDGKNWEPNAHKLAHKSKETLQS